MGAPLGVAGHGPIVGAPLLDPPELASADPLDDTPPEDDPLDDDPPDEEPEDDDPTGADPPEDDPADRGVPDDDPVGAPPSTALAGVLALPSFALLGPVEVAPVPASPDPLQSAPLGGGLEHAETIHPPETMAAMEKRRPGETIAAGRSDLEPMGAYGRESFIG